MNVRYKPKDWFTGRMYASMHSKDCQVSGTGNGSLMLHLDIGSEAKENRCGILRAYEMTHSYHRYVNLYIAEPELNFIACRTFISALVVIQNNANVQTQGDRLIKVGCILNNATTAVDLGVRDNNADGSEQVPSAIALESSLEYAEQ